MRIADYPYILSIALSLGFRILILAYLDMRGGHDRTYCADKVVTSGWSYKGSFLEFLL